MTERVHGYIIDDRLGALMGDNAFVSIAVDAGVDIKATGVLTPLNQFKALYAYNPAQGIEFSEPRRVDINDFSGAARMENLPNVPADLRTIKGVTYASDATYTTAWCAQENLRRLVDTVQQRGVLIAISNAGPLTGTPAVANVNVDDNTRKYGQWSASFTNAQTVTFLVERGYVFDKTRPNEYGQPSATQIGHELIDELLKLTLLSPTGQPVTLSDTNCAVRVDRSVPQIL